MDPMPQLRTVNRCRRDRDDKARVKAVRQELKIAEKQRRRAAAAAEGDGGGVVAMLGGSGGGGGGGDGDSSEDGGGGEEEDGGVRGGACSSSSAGEEEGPGVASGGDESDDSRGGVAPAYRELARRGAQSRGFLGRGSRGEEVGKAEPKAAKRKGSGGLSLADEEAMALRLLSRK